MARLLERPVDAVVGPDDGVSDASPGVPTHPWAWWAWALGTGAGVSITTNPLLVTLLVAALVLVVAARRTDDPWARSARVYITLGLGVIAIRMVFQILLGSDSTGTVLFTLPRLPLPTWAAGVSVGGPVTAEGLVGTGYDALRLAVMLGCFGAANTLANPRRTLKSVPAALHDMSVAVVIALSVFPQLIASVARIRRARRLRGDTTGRRHALRTIAVPVLEDAVEGSMSLARAMESRGFGRTRDNRRVPPGTTALLIVSMGLLTVGCFLVLSNPQWTVLPRLDGQGVGALLVLAGIAGGVAGLRSAGRRLRVTRYRPDRWTRRSVAIAACGPLAAGMVALLGRLSPLALNPPTSPLAWPQLDPLMLLAAVIVASPILLSQAPAPTHTPPEDLP